MPTARLPPPRAPAQAAALGVLTCCALAAISGCATTEAPADTQLGGEWQLDAAASDNVEALVTQAVNRAEARQRRRNSFAAGAAARNRGPVGGEEGAQSGQPGSEPVVLVPILGPDFKQLRAHLLQILGAPPTLSLQVQPEAVSIQNDHLPARDYEPGQSFVRFDEYGNATVSSGWKGGAFVVHERYMSHATLSERYEVDPKSGALTYTRELKDPAVGSLTLKSIYHHP